MGKKSILDLSYTFSVRHLEVSTQSHSGSTRSEVVAGAAVVVLVVVDRATAGFIMTFLP